MTHPSTASSIIITLVRSDEGEECAQRMIASVRAFGGRLAACPVWLYDTRQGAPIQDRKETGVTNMPLNVPESVRNYEFGDKVYACAQAEAMALANATSLIWIDPTCLVVQPPQLFDLGPTLDVAMRPVHIRNVGLAVSAPIDDYWKRVYATVGVTDIPLTVESFVDKQTLRAYFNTHAFAINPQMGLMRRWLELFSQLVGDREFQAGACADETHRVFLHQAILSALIATTLQPERICLLPPAYNYPYHLHSRVRAEDRPAFLNDLVCFAYEELAFAPGAVSDIGIREPLASWLVAHHTGR